MACWARMNSVKQPPQGVFVRLTRWLGGCEVSVLLAVVGIAAGVGTFALVASAVNAGDTQGFDGQILLAMRRSADLAPKGSPVFQQAARDITALGSSVVLGLITLITCGFLALDGKTRMAFFVCVSVTGGLTASSLLKDVFQRPRPDLVPYAVYVSGTSFPQRAFDDVRCHLSDFGGAARDALRNENASRPISSCSPPC